MTPAERTDWIVAQAGALGFDLCGVAPADDFAELARLPEWLARGYAGEMRYLHDPRRQSPQATLPGAHSIIACALNYNTSLPYSTDARASLEATVRQAPEAKRDKPAGLKPAATTDIAHEPGGHGSNLANQDRREAPTALPKADAGAARPQHQLTPACPGPAASERRGWISRYAWGDDYHDVLGAKLDALLDAMRAQFSATPFDARAYVDTGPVHERIAAHHAGLGWLGKNTCLINEHLGSWLFLGVVLTTLDLAPSGISNHPITKSPDDPISLPPDLCGQCTQCIDACPTGALVEPYVLDARRCISYLTIELRGPIPAEFHDALGWHVFGCDICQDVCPFNRRAPVTDDPRFLPRSVGALAAPDGAIARSPEASPSAGVGPMNHAMIKSPDHPMASPSPLAPNPSLFAPPLDALTSLSEAGFRALFRGSAVKRTKHAGLTRNARIALRNSLR